MDVLACPENRGRARYMSRAGDSAAPVGIAQRESRKRREGRAASNRWAGRATHPALCSSEEDDPAHGARVALRQAAAMALRAGVVVLGRQGEAVRDRIEERRRGDLVRLQESRVALSAGEIEVALAVADARLEPGARDLIRQLAEE